MTQSFGSEFMKLKTLLLRETKNLVRLPYFELMLFVLVFQVMSIYPLDFKISYIRGFPEQVQLRYDVTTFACARYFSYVLGQIRNSYLIIGFFSSALSYLAISYSRDIGFLKTEFSLPVRRSLIYLSKFLASYLALLILVTCSFSFSILLRNLPVLEFLDAVTLLSGIFIILFEAITVISLAVSITTLMAFVIKWPGISFIVSASVLYSLEFLSSNLQKSIFLLPTALGEFERRALMQTTEEVTISLSLYSFEPLLPSLLLSLLVFLFGYYYVTRRLEIQ